MIKISKKIAQLFCILYTIVTISSSAVNLALGRLTDTHVHLLDRAVLTLMGTIVFILMREGNFKSKFLRFIVPYAIFITLALFYVFVGGLLWKDLHPNAYRDIFLNDTIAYIVVYSAVAIIDKVKSKKASNNE